MIEPNEGKSLLQWASELAQKRMEDNLLVGIPFEGLGSTAFPVPRLPEAGKPLLVNVLERLDAIDARLASIEALLAGNDTPDAQEEVDESPLFLGGE